MLAAILNPVPVAGTTQLFQPVALVLTVFEAPEQDVVLAGLELVVTLSTGFMYSFVKPFVPAVPVPIAICPAFRVHALAIATTQAAM